MTDKPPSSADLGAPLEAGPWSPKAIVRANRRPMVLLVVSLTFLASQHVLLRWMAHGDVAHVLLGAGNGPPPTGAATLAVTLLIVRFASYVIVPGLLLAAGAELVAYALVGPKRDDENDDDPASLIDPDD